MLGGVIVSELVMLFAAATVSVLVNGDESTTTVVFVTFNILFFGAALVVGVRAAFVERHTAGLRARPYLTGPTPMVSCPSCGAMVPWVRRCRKCGSDFVVLPAAAARRVSTQGGGQSPSRNSAIAVGAITGAGLAALSVTTETTAVVTGVGVDDATGLTVDSDLSADLNIDTGNALEFGDLESDVADLDLGDFEF